MVESCPGVTYNPDYGLKFARSWQFENEKREAKIDHRKMIGKNPDRVAALASLGPYLWKRLQASFAKR
jgi:hypothetical protein